MPDMTPTSLAAAVVSRTGKIIKNVFLKGRKFATKWYTTLTIFIIFVNIDSRSE